ncbi:polysaccharide pyruvyl transferase family protein [Eubacterium callanderi]|uniref:polysaccharide pyruvyl transferase family protein n=1 Tax=Eubacterium callanderi TaxID=53442 RepID=UPI00399B285B
MKIGIITVHNGQNYGASLQAYALIQLLKKMGHEANLIDYRTKKIEDRMQSYKELSRWDSIKNIKKNLRYFSSNVFFGTKTHSVKVADTFLKFHEKIFESEYRTYRDANELYTLNKTYDVFICGSDQIWNPIITGLDDAFFLSFASTEKNTVAYAPSLGMESERVDEQMKNVLKEKLRSVKHLSVREANNCKLVEEITGRRCATVVDPVLLLQKDEWLKLIINEELIYPKGKYAFYYPVVEQKEMENFAIQECKKRGWHLVNPRLVPAYAKLRKYTCFSGKPVGPTEFLSLLAGAQAVFTNSFHATVFSSVFQKELVIIPLKGKHAARNNRIFEYLKMLNFGGEYTSKKIIHLNGIEFENVDKFLNIERLKSIEYLRNALNNV